MGGTCFDLPKCWFRDDESMQVYAAALSLVHICAFGAQAACCAVMLSACRPMRQDCAQVECNACVAGYDEDSTPSGADPSCKTPHASDSLGPHDSLT